MNPHTVAIVEDHVLLSQAIAGLVNNFKNFEVIYLCKNGKELLTKLKDDKNIPEIVLMDVNMPILDGIETTEIIKKQYPKIHVLALSVDENESSIIKMLKAGAKGYLLKDVEKAVLETALNDMVSQGYHYTKDVSQILVNSLTKDDSSDINQLKERELEFLHYVCSELTYKEIADKMFLSPKTIDGYRDTLFQKLHIKNRIGLVLYAIKQGIFKP